MKNVHPEYDGAGIWTHDLQNMTLLTYLTSIDQLTLTVVAILCERFWNQILPKVFAAFQTRSKQTEKCQNCENFFWWKHFSTFIWIFCRVKSLIVWGSDKIWSIVVDRNYFVRRVRLEVGLPLKLAGCSSAERTTRASHRTRCLGK